MSELKLYTPEHWIDYELIDSGGSEKLERFGKFVLTRPEPQAVWPKSLSPSEWEKISHAVFTRTRGIDPARHDSVEKGSWKKKPGIPDQWLISYAYKEMNLRYRLGFTSFGHIGIFPEQAVNWDYVYDLIAEAFRPSPLAVRPDHSAASKQPASKSHRQYRVLNLFAYTGGASLAARAAGADVVHVDSVRQVINWAGDNMLSSGLKDIRWVVEDALKFVRREAKRGNRYHGIILDPRHTEEVLKARNGYSRIRSAS